MAIETVVFNEGEPLDPDKLSKLQSNITNIYSQQGLLNTSITGLQGQVTSSFTDSGRETISGMNGGVYGKKTISISSSFSTNAIIVATVGQKISTKDEQVTIYVGKVSNGSFELGAKSSSTSRASLDINYIITEKKTVSP
jgi:hypothetical protein